MKEQSFLDRLCARITESQRFELEWFWKKTTFTAFGFIMFMIGAMCGYWLKGCVCS